MHLCRDGRILTHPYYGLKTRAFILREAAKVWKDFGYGKVTNVWPNYWAAISELDRLHWKGEV